MPYTKTPTQGSEDFPANENAAYTAIETLAAQDIRSVKSANRIVDGLYYYDVENGTVIEQAMIGLVESQALNRDQVATQIKDPTVYVRYFNNFTALQYYTTVRERDIRAIISGNGTATVESVTGEIIDTLTNSDGHDDFNYSRNLILSSTAYNFSTELGGKVPANMKGVVAVLRMMYNRMVSDNTKYTAIGEYMHVPPEDVRIAISDDLLALIDILYMAELFNMSKAELMGKLVIIPTNDLETGTIGTTANAYKVVVYDRKRMNRAQRLYEYLQPPKTPGLAVTTYLTVERAYFESELFKGIQIDCTKAFNAELNNILVEAD